MKRYCVLGKWPLQRPEKPCAPACVSTVWKYRGYPCRKRCRDNIPLVESSSTSSICQRILSEGADYVKALQTVQKPFLELLHTLRGVENNV